MAKIVVLAGASDTDAVSAALEAASIEFDIVDPTAANLLHIVIGMVEDEKPKEEKKSKEEKPAEEKPKEEKPAEEPASEEVPESLGAVTVDGEQVQAFANGLGSSTLFAKAVSLGAKTSYSVNEGTFSFWPANAEKPVQRMVVEHNNHRASVELVIKESKTSTSYLSVGEDLADMFKTK
jgi:hypothetical protein